MKRAFIRAASLVITGLVVLFMSSPSQSQTSKRPSQPMLLPASEEASRISKLSDGKLIASFLRERGMKQEAAARYSNDNGYSWSEAEALFTLPVSDGKFGGPHVLVDRAGEVHLFFVKVGSGNAGRPLPDRRIDIWHTKSVNGRTKWQQPRQIWEGYTGSLNSVIQLRSGRILLPFSYVTRRSWSDRGEGPDAFTYMGQFDCTLVYSDDAGTTWHRSPAALKVPAPNLSTYGAIEPVVTELKDGRVWMLIRTQMGRFYESFSRDGIVWSQPQPTSIISSDSPAGLVALDDGRIVLFWNNSLRFPYAYGGRHVLHAAISEDQGKTWRGYREVAHDPLNSQPPPPTGDHGTAYPFPILGREGKVIFASGQGKGRRFRALLDPEWLYETSHQTDFSRGLADWSIFGTKGVSLVHHPQKAGAQVLSILKSDSVWPASAVWNFPAGLKGQLRLRLLLKPGFKGLNIGLTDHYSVPFDTEDQFHNLYNFRIGSGGELRKKVKLQANRWYKVDLAWDRARRDCRVFVDGREIEKLSLLREGAAVSYLRLRSTAEQPDSAGVLIEQVKADVWDRCRSPRCR